jgi:hypothetical protein
MGLKGVGSRKVSYFAERFRYGALFYIPPKRGFLEEAWGEVQGCSLCGKNLEREGVGFLGTSGNRNGEK